MQTWVASSALSLVSGLATSQLLRCSLVSLAGGHTAALTIDGYLFEFYSVVEIRQAKESDVVCVACLVGFE